MIEAIHQPPTAAVSAGVIALHAGNHTAAEPHFRRALRKPGGRRDPRLYANLGATLGLKGDYRGAAAAYRQAIRLEPSARRFHELGTALALQGLFAESKEAFGTAVSLGPTAMSWYALSTAQRGLEQWDDAARSCREAIKLKPDFAEAIATLATLLCKRWESGDEWDLLDESIAATDAACAYDLSWENLTNLALRHQLAGNYDKAIPLWDMLLAEGQLSHHNRALRSMIPLIRGEFTEGFREFEHAFLSEIDSSIYPSDRPRWDGQPIAGTIVLCATHGYGDCFQFIRYAGRVRARCGRVVVAALENSGHHHAATLLAQASGVDEVITDAALMPDHDAWTPILSLPHIFGTTLDTVPARVPYLWPNSPTVERRRSVAEAIPGFKIGVCWRGDSRNHTDPRRSFKPELLAPLAEIPGVTLLALQLGRDDEIAGLPIHPVPGRETWMDTAAVIAGLDLIIAADTGIAHLAGAMGVPTWIALNDPPDWRYLLDREDSPWYPTVRLFRQKPRGAWPEVFERVLAALHETVSTHRGKHQWQA